MPSSEPPPVPVAASVARSIYEHLRSEILSGTIAAGTRLQQGKLARRYGVSITPVRQALSALTADGFVDASPFSGSVVHQPTLQELDDIYELRAALMPMLVEQSMARISPEEIASAETLAEVMRTEARLGSWSEANRNFHLTLDRACANGQLLSTMTRLADLWRGYVALSVASEARQHRADEEHVELVNLYRAKDVPGATAVMLQHIGETHRLVRKMFEEKA